MIWFFPMTLLLWFRGRDTGPAPVIPDAPKVSHTFTMNRTVSTEMEV